MNRFDDVSTERIALRRPVESDIDAVHRIHADPKTNLHNPSGPDDDAKSSRRLEGWMDHWARYDFGYWTVLVDGAVAGFSGLQHAEWLERPILNLYYRYAPEFWGQGYAVEVARFAVNRGIESFPETPVLARTKIENVGSQRTALAAGLHRREDLDRHDGTGIGIIFVSSWA